MEINIIIPVLNEEKSLKNKIKEVIDYLETTEMKDHYVITIIDNGSTDRTQKLGVQLTGQYKTIVSYIRLEQRGVGLALREGIRCNKCDVVGYMDLDLATDIRHLRQVYRLFKRSNCQIVIGSRLLKTSKVIGRSLVRNITSRALNLILKIYLGVKFSDAMCGFKFYRKDVADRLLVKCSNNAGWFYCAEMLIWAEWLGISIKEIPVVWTDDLDSKVKIGKLSWSYLKEIEKLHKEKRVNRR